MEYETGLLIGRFQPFHRGHLHAVSYALNGASRLLLGIGSSDRSREPSNPFTASERRSMILNSLGAAALKRVEIYEIPDVHNHVRWMETIREALPAFGVVFTNDALTAGLYRREGTPVSGIPFLDRPSLSGTAVRERISSDRSWEHLVPPGTAGVVRQVVGAIRWPAGDSGGHA